MVLLYRIYNAQLTIYRQHSTAHQSTQEQEQEQTETVEQPNTANQTTNKYSQIAKYEESTQQLLNFLLSSFFIFICLFQLNTRRSPGNGRKLMAHRPWKGEGAS